MKEDYHSSISFQYDPIFVWEDRSNKLKITGISDESTIIGMKYDCIIMIDC